MHISTRPIKNDTMGAKFKRIARSGRNRQSSSHNEVFLTSKGAHSMTTASIAVISRAQQPFTNEPLIDFNKAEHKRAQIEALAQVKSELGRTYPLIIGGQKISSTDTFASVNP